MRETTASTENVTKQIKMNVGANREHSSGADNVLEMLGAIRQITDRNAEGVGLTATETAGLQEQASRISALMDSLSTREATAFGPISDSAEVVETEPRTTGKNGSAGSDDQH
jgi:hypothetical protein